MILRLVQFGLIGIVLVSCKQEKKGKAPDELKATIDIQSRAEPISPKIYGMFMEQLGNVDVGDLVDDGLWSELLDDRKFFYPIDLVDQQIPPNKRDTTNQWRPINDPRAVVMDSIKPYAGIRSPKIRTSTKVLEGISQSGFPVIADKKYNGRIVLKGSPGVTVTIGLSWGKGPSQKTSYTISKLAKRFSKYNFTFTAKETSDNAKLEITGSGDGEFSIGAVSLMPEDNINGFRPDVIKLLRDLNSGIYRWGGNMSSAYDWRDGVGDPDQRPPRYEYAWDALENNDVGTDEMLMFAKLINVELCISANAGLGDANSAAEWVEYVNGSKDSRMGKRRAENGHADPYGVKLWCVGNEMYGWWQLGHTDLKSYTIKHNQFAEKMRAVDPTIKLIASGATIDEMTITECAFKVTGKVTAEYDSVSDWTGGLLRHDLRNIDYMSEHFYCSVDQRFDLKKGKYVKVDEPLVDWTRRPANRVRAKAEHYEEYHRRIPASKKIPVYMDEWAFFTNWVHPLPTLGVTIGYARGLHEMFRHTDLIKMAGFTFGTSCISFDKTNAVYNSSGLLFKLYQSQFGTIPVKITGNSPQPAPQYPIGGDQPTINAGGDAYPLDMVAALTSDQKALTIAIVNPTETDQKITIQLSGVKTSGKIKHYMISGTSINARNIVGKKPQVTTSESDLDPTEILVVAPATINIYRYELD